MKILIYGAGLTGSLLAARLVESGHQVAILARGQRLANLRQDGVILLDMTTGIGSAAQVDVVGRLAPDDFYDWIIVAMGKQHLANVLPVLAANRVSTNILLVGNNVAGRRELVSVLGSQRAALGFALGAGRLEGSVAMYAHLPSGLQLIIGELDGSPTPRLVELAATLVNAGVRVELSPDIDAQLKSIAALFLPAYAAYYLAGNDICRLANTRDAILLMVRGMCEALQVLRANRVPIIPRPLQALAWIPEPLLVPILQRAMKQPNVEYIFANAAALRPEMRQLAREFCVLAGNGCIVTPNLDRLIFATTTDAHRLAEGSCDYPLDWRPVWITMGILAASLALFYSVIHRRFRRSR